MRSIIDSRRGGKKEKKDEGELFEKIDVKSWAIVPKFINQFLLVSLLGTAYPNSCVDIRTGAIGMR